MRILPVILFLPQLLFAQQVFSVEQLKKDLAIFRTALEESHPGLYRFKDKPAMDEYFAKAEAQLTKPLGLVDFYKTLTPVISALGCGHTSCSLPREFFQSSGLADDRLPVDVRILNNKVFITANFSGDQALAPGTEIVQVDGTSVNTILADIYPHLSCDGVIKTGRTARIEQNFARYLRLFFKESKSYTLSVSGKDGKLVSKNVGIDGRTVASDNKPGLSLSINDNQHTAVLTVRSFSSDVSDDKGTGYETFMAGAFSRIKSEKVEKLIIDVRGNGGGRDDFGALLFAYLTDKPFEYYHYLEMNKPKMSFISYTSRNQEWVAQLNDRLDEGGGRYYYKKDQHPCLPQQAPRLNSFQGKVIVLTDGRSFSATAEFAAITRFKGRATFIGEETGGAYEGNTSGGGIEVTLPATKIRLNVPLTKYASAVTVDPSLKGRGIIPDIILSPGINDVLKGKDIVMQKALSL